MEHRFERRQDARRGLKQRLAGSIKSSRDRPDVDAASTWSSILGAAR